MGFDETLLRHPEDVGYLTPGDLLFPGPSDELVAPARKGRLFLGQVAEFISGAHIGSVTELTRLNKCAKLSYMKDKTTQAWDRGNREASKVRTCDDWDCPCTLTYWETRISSWPAAERDAFYNGWTYAATGDPEYARP